MQCKAKVYLQHFLVVFLRFPRHEDECKWDLLRVLVFLDECVHAVQLVERVLFTQYTKCPVDIPPFGLLQQCQLRLSREDDVPRGIYS